MNSLRKVDSAEFHLFLPLIPKGKMLKFRRIKKSPLGDLGAKGLFGADSLYENLGFTICHISDTELWALSLLKCRSAVEM